MNNSMQNIKTLSFAKLSLLSITLAGLFTSAHHLYRFGFDFLISAIILTFLPYVLFRWFKHTRNKTVKNIVFSAYGLFNGFLIFSLGLIDGGLDHTLRLLNNHVLAPLNDGVPPIIS
jgi:predicted PurR-regulated permease PerM